MTEIRFYHLQTMRLEQALPGILTQAYNRGMRAVVKFSTPERLQVMDDHLWSFSPASFLPHSGSDKPGEQPIWLTLEDENPNQAVLLVLTEGAASDMIESFDLCCEIFDDADEKAVIAAREKWADFKGKGFALKYYQQTEQGGWEEKASSAPAV